MIAAAFVPFHWHGSLTYAEGGEVELSEILKSFTK
jgi:hypothetical protein